MINISFPREKSIGLLLDPDKAKGDILKKIVDIATKNKTDYILVGGSLTFDKTDSLIESIRKYTSIPVVLFPGNLLQLTDKADIILLLSLISGRNAELLIGNHVVAAPFLKGSKDKIVPVGYILIDSGTRTSVEYVSQTEPIPRNKPEIVVATALAGEMLGLKMIYLEAGSGASQTVPIEIIKAVRENISIPVVVGGGIRTREEIRDIFKAGANMIVLGNSCETDPALLEDACKIRDEFCL
jgi:phosphoglycerol geranylgeranyltransferase